MNIVSIIAVIVSAIGAVFGFVFGMRQNDKRKAAEKAIETTFGKKPLPFYSGGSIPIISGFEQILGIKSLLIGFGLSQDAIHSPNESYGLDQFRKGVETIPWFYKYFAGE